MCGIDNLRFTAVRSEMQHGTCDSSWLSADKRRTASKASSKSVVMVHDYTHTAWIQYSVMTHLKRAA